ncbi:hypothetical protein [Streptomyces sp. NPDC006463]|uniref:hypothetical protein n=1 Tax=Streptomyces sp. NPDC006463 TaxID=3364746 RepID=UPI00367AB05C
MSARSSDGGPQLSGRSPGGDTGGRLAALDGVRILAALAVVFYHYVVLESAWGRPTEGVFPVARPLAVYGWLGVEIFFLSVASSYV